MLDPVNPTLHELKNVAGDMYLKVGLKVAKKSKCKKGVTKKEKKLKKFFLIT